MYIRAPIFIILVLFLIGPLTLLSTGMANAQPFAYITNQFAATVSVIDTSNNTVIATVGVGCCPIGVAVTPDGTFVYVVNLIDGTVSVIDTSNNTVIATVTVGG